MTVLEDAAPVPEPAPEPKPPADHLADPVAAVAAPSEPLPGELPAAGQPAAEYPAAEHPAAGQPAAEPLAAEPEATAPAQRLPLDEAGRDLLFRSARTLWSWRDEPVPDDTLRQLYDLLKLAPTSANCSPARFMFLRTPESKQRLRPALSAGNVDKTLAAPVVCIVAHDPRFYEDLPRLFPGVDARAWFAGNDELANETAFRNGTLQGAYLILAARAVGLDCGPMSGFDNATIDQEFLVAQGWKSNFLIALGHADPAAAGERAPRLTFDEACRLL